MFLNAQDLRLMSLKKHLVGKSNGGIDMAQEEIQKRAEESSMRVLGRISAAYVEGYIEEKREFEKIILKHNLLEFLD